MLPGVENIPHTPDQWMRWAFDHRDSHDRIRAAIQKQYNLSLTDWQIEPINPQSFTQFLQNNSQLHGDMNGVLGLQSSDLQDANLSDERSLQAWIRLHYLEHWYAEQKLQI